MNNLGLMILEEYKDSNNQNQGMLLKAIKYFEEAYTFGNIKAAINLGICYEKGLGVNQNIQKAKSYFREAADKGDMNGKMLLCHHLIKDADNNQSEEDYFQAYQHLQDVVRKNNNHSQAYYLLGYLYENGFGVTEDIKIAKNYYLKATQCNPPSSSAFTKLGDFYYQQQKQNWNDNKYQELAVDYYEKAAKLGNRTAMNHLGALNQQGIFGRQNVEEAKKYYKQAGDKQGYLNLAFLYSQMQMPEEKIQKNLVKASELGEQKAIDILTAQVQNYVNDEKAIHDIQQQNPEILNKQLLLSKQQSTLQSKMPVVQSIYQSSLPKKQFHEQKQQQQIEEKLNHTCRKIFLQESINNQQFIHLSNLKHTLQLILNELTIQISVTDEIIQKLHTQFSDDQEIITHINYQELLLIAKTLIENKQNQFYQL